LKEEYLREFGKGSPTSLKSGTRTLRTVRLRNLEIYLAGGWLFLSERGEGVKCGGENIGGGITPWTGKW